MNLTSNQIELFERFHPELADLPQSEKAIRLNELAAQGLDSEVVKFLHSALEMPRSSRQLEGLDCGDCKLIEMIGAGGCGVVYRAKQRILSAEPDVAVKFIRPELLLNPDHGDKLVERFYYEASALSEINDVGIVRVRGGGIFRAAESDKPTPYLVMDYVDGDPINRACSGWRLTDKIALFIKLCEAVQAAHAKGHAHLDLKPGNVCVRRNDRQPVVLDFGQARAIEAAAPYLAHPVWHEGTLPYLSPEQIDSKIGPIHFRSDVHALGVILFEILTDSLPYPLTKRTNIAEFKRAITLKTRVRLRERNHELRVELEKIVDRSMAWDPSARFDSPMALARALRELEEIVPDGTRQDGCKSNAVQKESNGVEICVTSEQVFIRAPGGSFGANSAIAPPPPIFTLSTPTNLETASEAVLMSVGLLLKQTTAPWELLGCAWKHGDWQVICAPEVGQKVKASINRGEKVIIQWGCFSKEEQHLQTRHAQIIGVDPEGGTMWWLRTFPDSRSVRSLTFSGFQPNRDGEVVAVATVERDAKDEWHLYWLNLNAAGWETTEEKRITSNPDLRGRQYCPGSPVWNRFRSVVGYLNRVDTSWIVSTSGLSVFFKQAPAHGY